MRSIVFLLLAVAVPVVLYVADRRGRLLAALLVLLAVTGAWFGVAFAAFWTDFRDADGFVDCWPDCSVLQDATGLGVFGAPILFLGALACSMLIRGFRSRRGRRSLY